jgi:hypothetical protein
MISKCLNPKCNHELNYLRSGRVIRAVRQAGDTTQIEHYWLCGDCSKLYDFSFLPDGTVTASFRPGEAPVVWSGRHSPLDDVERLRA